MATPELDIVASLADWKLVFRSLHAHLTEHLELMDAEVFAELQRRLQARAREEGVDVTDHAAWDAWLGNEDAASCEERLAKRENLH
jgi:hypothetical protein